MRRDTPQSPRLQNLKSARRMTTAAGAVAQLGERCVRNAEVGSSTLLRSTKHNPLTPVVSGLFSLGGQALVAGGETVPIFVRRKWDCPAFLTTVCHCLEQAVPGQPVTPGTASAKQWHTVGIFPRVVRNADCPLATAISRDGDALPRTGCKHSRKDLVRNNCPISLLGWQFNCHPNAGRAGK